MISPAALARDLLAGQRLALARALRLVEDAPAAGQELLAQLPAPPATPWMWGVTGSPGAGKSSVVDALIGVVRQRALRVGVLAVDPSSPFTGGALLGDRIRMQRHHQDDGVFVRSMATRGCLGGLSRATFDAALVLRAAGFERVIVETVGVGQDEVDVAQLAHSTLVVLVPGMGDDVQASKAGLMEVADVFVINKADRDGVPQLERGLRQMLSLAPAAQAWAPPIVHTVAPRGTGVAALLAALDDHAAHLASPAGRAREQTRRAGLFDALVDAALVADGRGQLAAALQAAHARVRAGHDPHAELRALRAALAALHGDRS